MGWIPRSAGEWRMYGRFIEEDRERELRRQNNLKTIIEEAEEKRSKLFQSGHISRVIRDHLDDPKHFDGFGAIK